MSALNAPLLVELFVEELPPKALKALGAAFAQGLLHGLQAEGLATPHTQVTPFASPRRLAVRLTPVASQAADQAVLHKLMPPSVGLDAAGQATPALIKKLASLGETAAALSRIQQQGEGKAATLLLPAVKPGATLGEGLQRALATTLAALPIPKVMQYPLADGWQTVHFVRPAHGLVALHGTDVVPVSVLGLTAGRSTQGHRFEARVPHIVLPSADDYEDALAEQGAVIASFAERRAEIVRQLAAAAAAVHLMPIEDDALLDEVAALVERPNVLTCAFETAFLDVPQECLILTMKANQKYFPLLDANGRLSHRFLVVSNIRPADPSRVIQGNERVVRPRLADAQFFFQQDRKKPLADRIAGLAQVVYHGKLGSQGARVERVRAIARHLAGRLNPALVELADRAALLAKADLLTDMVGEFPELQGVMGGYYARHDGEDEAVALAIEDHYKPRFAGDALPRGDVGLVVALADKLETLVGLFAIGQTPTGDKDPFALRRHALGVLRMLMERQLPLVLDDLVRTALATLAQPATEAATPAQQTVETVLGFLFDRLTGLLREQGYSALEVDAVVAVRPPWGEIGDRLAAVRAFAELPEAPALAAANKRVGNILKKAERAPSAAELDPGKLAEPAEQALYAALAQVAPTSADAVAAGRYTEGLAQLAALKAPVDRFFDEVMVNAEDPEVRRNRLALLASLHAAMNRVADLSRLAV